MSTAERLKAQIAAYSVQIHQARTEHGVRISTLASEAVDLQNEYIVILESRISSLEDQLKFYSTWEETRELTELLDKIKTLEAENSKLQNTWLSSV